MGNPGPNSLKAKSVPLLTGAMAFAVLLGLWMLFVSLLQMNELVAGFAAAAIGSAANAVVKKTDFVHFHPQLKHLLLIFTEPWYVLTGTAAVFWALARRIAGKKSEAELKVVPFDAGGEDRASATRRALAVAYTTISPNSIVVGIDHKGRYMMVHQISPSGTPWITQQLGAQR